MTRVPVEDLHEGDLVRAVEHGPQGRVVDPARRGWTVVKYGSGEAMSYRHGDRLYLLEGANVREIPESEDKGWVISEQVVGDGTRLRQRRVLVVMRANAGFADSEGPTLFSLDELEDFIADLRHHASEVW